MGCHPRGSPPEGAYGHPALPVARHLAVLVERDTLIVVAFFAFVGELEFKCVDFAEAQELEVVVGVGVERRFCNVRNVEDVEASSSEAFSVGVVQTERSVASLIVEARGVSRQHENETSFMPHQGLDVVDVPCPLCEQLTEFL